MDMPDKVKLLSPSLLMALDDEGSACLEETDLANLVALARWAAKAHALLEWMQEHRNGSPNAFYAKFDRDGRILLDEIDTTETPK